MGEDQNAIANIFKDHKKALSVLSSIAALVGMILFLLWFFKDKPKEPVTAERILKWDEVAYIDENGKPQLKQWRIEDIKGKIKSLEKAEQYVLVAASDGAFECFHCERGTCFLKKGMIWKYGVTRQGVGGRYDNDWLNRMRLTYIVQFNGTYQECLTEELRKIGLYPLHQDNLSRHVSERMARPPGNKIDSWQTNKMLYFCPKK